MSSQVRDGRIAEGRRAAYGARQLTKTAVRARVFWELRRLARWRAHTSRGDYIEFVPATRDAATIADLAGRINWYLPNRNVPVYVEGAADVPFAPTDAPYLDPEFVRDPGWERARPKGRPEIVVHDVTPRAVARYLGGSSRATIASPWFFGDAEWGYFDLHARYCITKIPHPGESAERLLALARPGGSAFVLATGPSAALIDPASVTADLRITCNSAVRDQDLLDVLRPDVLAFTDPIFHCGPSLYAAAFRADVRRAIAESDVLLLSGHHWVGPLVAHCPDIAARLAVIPMRDDAPWHWPSVAEPWVRATSNVLTNLMLPAAFALAGEVQIAGSDGRRPGERYFWQHNTRTQYADDLMNTAFAAHPAFFRDRNYADYYATHCRDLEQLLSAAEQHGKSVRGVTPSYIPALARRGAARPAE